MPGPRKETEREGKDPMLAQTCLGNMINKSKFPTLGDLQECLTLKESTHDVSYGVTGLTRDSVLYLSVVGDL